ncbi:phospholipase-like protein [Tanacetum coccineum]|uniref:Phospholipase-like protein n=1 Tax=Tanacetum coccineum TaxID=301880 RepID=A0ABQ5FNR6_9ASTR
MARCNDLYDVKIIVRSSVKLLKEIIDLLKKNPNRQRLFRRTVFGPWLDILSHDNDNHLMHYVLHHQVSVSKVTSACPPLIFNIGDHCLRFGRKEFCLMSGFRFGKVSEKYSKLSPFCQRLFPEKINKKGVLNLKSIELLGVLRNTETWIGLFDMDAVRVCLLLVVELVFMGKEDRICIPMHLVSLVEDFDCWNMYPWGEYMWVKFYQRTVNVAAKHREFHLVKKKQNPNYYPTYNLYGFPLSFKDSNPNLELYATPVEQQTEWFKARIKYINGLVEKNVFEYDIGGDVSNNSFDLNDNFIPCNDRSKGNHNAVNPGLTTLANHPLSTCSRHVVDNPEVACAGTGIHNPARNNDSRNSNHNVVYKGIYCSAKDHMSSCFSPEMPNDEVVVVGTAIHNTDEMYDSPNCVTDNDVNERISVSSNYSMLNTCCPEIHNAKILVVGIGIDKADENIYNPDANDNDVNQGIAVSFNAHMSNSFGHDMPNVVVVVACMGIDKLDGHNDNPNTNDNDVNQGIDPMVSKVIVAGMEIDKGDGHIDIPTASDNDVNLAKFIYVNDLMPISVSPDMLNAEVAICSMGFQNEVASNAVYEGNVVSAKEVGLDVLIQVAYDGMGIDKVDGYSQHEPSTLNALIEGFDSQNNNPRIDFLQHDDHVDCSVAKQNDHSIADIGVKPVHENEFSDDFMDVLNNEESLLKVSLDDMNVDEQEEKLIDTVKAQSNKSDYVNVVTDDYKPCLASVFAQVKKERKKSDMKTNYVSRSVKERKNRLSMALESPFGQQPPTTPVLPKRISRSVNCDFEEDVSGQPKIGSINKLMTMEVFVEGYRDIPVDREFWLVLACLDKSKQGWLKDSETMVAKHKENIATTAYFVSQQARGFTEQRHSTRGTNGGSALSPPHLLMPHLTLHRATLLTLIRRRMRRTPEVILADYSCRWRETLMFLSHIMMSTLLMNVERKDEEDEEEKEEHLAIGQRRFWTYIGINLVAVGMDGNNQIIPITTGVSQGETGESWTWFLRKLKECIGFEKLMWVFTVVRTDATQKLVEAGNMVTKKQKSTQQAKSSQGNNYQSETHQDGNHNVYEQKDAMENIKRYIVTIFPKSLSSVLEDPADSDPKSLSSVLEDPANSDPCFVTWETSSTTCTFRLGEPPNLRVLDPHATSFPTTFP